MLTYKTTLMEVADEPDESSCEVLEDAHNNNVELLTYSPVDPIAGSIDATTGEVLDPAISNHPKGFQMVRDSDEEPRGQKKKKKKDSGDWDCEDVTCFPCYCNCSNCSFPNCKGCGDICDCDDDL